MLNDQIYLAALGPEAIVEQNGKVIHPTYDLNKNDVYAIAITVLLCCSEPSIVRQGLSSFYRRSQGRVELNKEAIETALNFMLTRQNRSPVLVNTLRIMLSERETDRPSLYQILEFMRVASA